jgi:chromate reductase
MSNPLDVAAIVGSLRRDSYTRRLTEALARLAGESMVVEILEIRDLSMYNQDDEEFAPPAWVAFRSRIKRADGVLFATPEYNRSMPACIKNAIDVGSRPSIANVWAGRPVAVISASPGKLGGFGANQHLRQTLMSVQAPAMPAPEAYIGGSNELFDADGQFVNTVTRELCEKFVRSFATWIRQLTGQ